MFLTPLKSMSKVLCSAMPRSFAYIYIYIYTYIHTYIDVSEYLPASVPNFTTCLLERRMSHLKRHYSSNIAIYKRLMVTLNFLSTLRMI
jgi:hypothetical protein